MLGRDGLDEIHETAPVRLGRMPRVVVIGGGISGLSAAFRLRELQPRLDVTLLEAGPTVGGVLRTERRDGYLIEASADSFITSLTWGIDLCRRVGLSSQLLETTADKRRAFVVHNGRLQPIPEGLMVMAPTRVGPILRTPILSPWGKLRLAAEWFVRRGAGEDESLAAFASRRFGREAFERLIQPLVSGMYTGDPTRLSVRATLPRFLELEARYRSLIRGLRKTAHENPSSGSGARYGMFVGLRDGMGSLIEAIVRMLPPGSILCDSPVKSLSRLEDTRWRIELETPGAAPILADALILATPIGRTTRLLRAAAPDLAQRLGAIETARSAIASLAYRREQIADSLNGFGFVVPIRERRRILSASYSSIKFPGRAPDGHVLIRVFLGGATRPEILENDDETLTRIAHEELVQLLGIVGSPEFSSVHRWLDVMPQYQVGHLERVDEIEAAVDLLPGLALAGNAFRGIGVPQCIRQGEQAALKVSEFVATRFDDSHL